MGRPWTALAVVGALLAASNLVASSLLGPGDAEALYWCYGRHPDLAYLDHPPLIGWLLWLATSWNGSPLWAVRLVPLVMAELTLLLTFLTARDLHGDRAAGWSSLLLLSLPAFAVGLTAAAPDAPLVALCSAFVWQLCRAVVDEREGRWPRLGRPVLLGALLGLAFLAKHTGACLVIGAAVVIASRPGRRWARRPGTWIGAAVAAALALPVLVWNIQHDWTGAAHRLVWTQEGAGFSPRNLGALLGGQLLYAGPLTLPLLAWGAVRAWRARGEDARHLVLLATSLPTLALTYALCLWSDVAEPHWPAVGYLPLVPAAAGLVASGSTRARGLARCAAGVGLVVLFGLHVVVLSPLLPRFGGDGYEPRYDLGNELRGWDELAGAIRALNREGQPVLAAHYTQCAQLTYALRLAGDPQVRCVSPETDDFDLWHGPFTTPPGGALFVTDNRFEHDPAALLPGAAVVGPPVIVEIRRGGRWVRRFSVHRLER